MPGPDVADVSVMDLTVFWPEVNESREEIDYNIASAMVDGAQNDQEKKSALEDLFVFNRGRFSDSALALVESFLVQQNGNNSIYSQDVNKLEFISDSTLVEPQNASVRWRGISGSTLDSSVEYPTENDLFEGELNRNSLADVFQAVYNKKFQSKIHPLMASIPFPSDSSFEEKKEFLANNIEMFKQILNGEYIPKYSEALIFAEALKIDENNFKLAWLITGLAEEARIVGEIQEVVENVASNDTSYAQDTNISDLRLMMNSASEILGERRPELIEFTKKERDELIKFLMRAGIKKALAKKTVLRAVYALRGHLKSKQNIKYTTNHDFGSGRRNGDIGAPIFATKEDQIFWRLMRSSELLLDEKGPRLQDIKYDPELGVEFCLRTDLFTRAQIELIVANVLGVNDEFVPRKVVKSVKQGWSTASNSELKPKNYLEYVTYGESNAQPIVKLRGMDYKFNANDGIYKEIMKLSPDKYHLLAKLLLNKERVTGFSYNKKYGAMVEFSDIEGGVPLSSELWMVISDIKVQEYDVLASFSNKYTKKWQKSFGAGHQDSQKLLNMGVNRQTGMMTTGALLKAVNSLVIMR